MRQIDETEPAGRNEHVPEKDLIAELAFTLRKPRRSRTIVRGVPRMLAQDRA